MESEEELKLKLQSYFIYPDERARLNAHSTQECRDHSCCICAFIKPGINALEDTQQQRLVKWVESNGGFLHPDLELSILPVTGHFVHKKDARKDLPVRTQLVRCPTSLTISFLNAIQMGPFQSHGTTFPADFLGQIDDYTIMVFFLIEQYRLKESSFWWPYINTLPQPSDSSSIGTLPYYSDKDVRWLTGTNLYGAVNTQTDQWKSKYSLGLRILERLEWPYFASYTWELFKWAATILSTRSFSSKVLEGALAEEIMQMSDPTVSKAITEGFNVLLPLVDMLNHDPYAKAEWHANIQHVGLSYPTEVACRPFTDESTGAVYSSLNNNYGPKSNEELLMSYGFCLDSNPYNFFKVGFRIPPGSPLDQIKQAQQEAFGFGSADLVNHHYFICRSDYPPLSSNRSRETELCIFSYNLWEATAILCANNRELSSIEVTEESCGIELSSYGNSRNTLNTHSQFLAELGHRIMTLRRNAPPQSAQPENRRQANAKLYRSSLIDILENAVVALEWQLFRARTVNSTEWTREKWLPVYEDFLSMLPFEPDPKLFNSDAFDRPSLLRQPGELFSPETIFSLTPDLSHVKEICLAISSHVTDTPVFAAPSKTIYAVFILYITSVYARYVQLKETNPQRPHDFSPRLEHFAAFIHSNYGDPPAPTTTSDIETDNEDQQLDPEEIDFLENLHASLIPIARSESTSTSFKQADQILGSPDWLNASSLKWAWYVITEEGVNVGSAGWDALWEQGGGERPAGKLRKSRNEMKEKMMTEFGNSFARGYLLYIPHKRDE